MSDFSNIKKELSEGRTVMAFTKGVSMQPLLYEGKTSVVLKPLGSPLKKYDLPICILPDGRYIIHRIIKIDGDTIYTRGDNCLTSEKFTSEKIIGIVTEIKRKNKTIKVTDKSYLAYAHIWNSIYPIRRIYYKIRIKAGVLWEKIKH